VIKPRLLGKLGDSNRAGKLAAKYIMGKLLKVDDNLTVTGQASAVKK
jgi:hypothetical protein